MSESNTGSMGPGARGRAVVVGLWVALSLATAVLLLLPWLWWQGGSAELQVPSTWIRPAGGNAWSLPLWRVTRHLFPPIEPGTEGPPESFLFHAAPSDGGARGGLRLFEDGFELGPATARPQDIEADGGGRFRHLSYGLVRFSPSDGSDPRTNGRRYSVRGFARPKLEAAPIALLTVAWLVGVGVVATVARRWRAVAAAVERSGALAPRPLFVFATTVGVSAYSLGFPLPHQRLPVVLLALLAGAGAVLLWRPDRLRPSPGALCLASFLAWGVVRTLLGDPSPEARTTLVLLVLCAALGLPIVGAMEGGLAGAGRCPGLLVAVLLSLVAVAVLAQNLGFDLRGTALQLAGVDRPAWSASEWEQKLRETWLVLAALPIAAAFASAAARRWRRLFAVLACVGAAIASGYSWSTRLAFASALLVLPLALRFPRPAKRVLAATCALVLFAMPWVAGRGLAAAGHLDPEGQLGRRMVRRLVIWTYARQLIARRPVLGRGLGTSSGLPGRRPHETAAELVDGGATLPPALAGLRPLPGGHPHNLALLIWLELGAVGAALAAATAWFAVARADPDDDPMRSAALAATVLAALVVFGLNYPAWDPPLLLLTVAAIGLFGASRPHRDAVEAVSRRRDDALETSA